MNLTNDYDYTADSTLPAEPTIVELNWNCYTRQTARLANTISRVE